MNNSSRFYMYYIEKPKSLYISILIIAWSLIYAQVTFSQYSVGYPSVINFTTNDYNAHSQNWGLAQGINGIMYFANGAGVLVYDGNDWQKIALKHDKAARALAVAETGTVYVGGSNEFGYLSSDSSGNYKYKSLLSLVPDKYLDFDNILHVNITKYGVFFHSAHLVFLYRNNAIAAFAFEHNTFPVLTNEYYIFAQPSGELYKFNGSNFENLNIENPQRELKLFEVLPYSTNKVLLLTRRRGLQIFDIEQIEKNGALTSFAPELKAFFINKIPKTASILPDGNIAIGTENDGLVILSRKGKLLKHINRDINLQENRIWDSFTDADGNLWLALEKGISVLEYNKPFRYFNGKNAPVGGVNTLKHIISKKSGQPEPMLLAGTMKGLEYYMLNSRKSTKYAFREKHSTNLKVTINDLLELNDEVLIAAKDGIYAFNNGQPEKITDSDYMHVSRMRLIGNNRLVANTHFRVAIFEIKKVAGKIRLHELASFNNISGSFKYFETSEDGDIWVAKPRKGIHKYKINMQSNELELLQEYSISDSLSVNEFTGMYRSGDSLFAFSYEGTFLFNEATNSFSRLPKEYGLAATSALVFAEHDRFGNFWGISQSDEKIVFKPASENFNNTKMVLNQLAQHPFWAINITKSGDVYLGSPANITIFNNVKYQTNSFQVILREITVQNENEGTSETLIGKARFANSSLKKTPVLASCENALSFRFSATSFSNKGSNLFSYKLEGFDSEWSEYAHSNHKEYSFLAPGDYTFKVKAVDSYGNHGEPAAFSFVIATPWFLTIYAIVIYIIITIMAMYGLIKLNAYRLKRDKETLQKRVAEKTHKLQIQQNDLIAAYEELQTHQEEIIAQREALEDQNKKLEKLSIAVRETNNGIAILDTVGEITWVNEAFDLLHCNPDEPEKQEAISQLLKKNAQPVVKSGKGVTFESSINTIPLSWRQTSITPIFDESGKIGRLVVVETDISELKNAEQTISEQHEDIKAAIRYAKSIQTAMLPTAKDLDRWFCNFILYLPKDIVSGDFYWHSVLPNGTDFGCHYFVLGDCTGHGVPGAFMSMIGMQMLSQIITEDKVESPEDILELLDTRIVNALNQKSGMNQDGMDMGIVRIEHKKDKYHVTWSNAKRPLFYKISGQSETIIVPSTRRSIGGYFENRELSFINTELVLEKNAILYLTSDGYGDSQTDNGKRLGRRKLHALLSKISPLEMSDQKEILETSVHSSLTGHEQLDDISIIGLKLN